MILIVTLKINEYPYVLQITPKEESIAALVELAKQDEKQNVANKPVEPERTRSGTWGSQSTRKDKDTPVKKTPVRKDKEIRKSSDDRRQKRGQ